MKELRFSIVKENGEGKNVSVIQKANSIKKEQNTKNVATDKIKRLKVQTKELSENITYLKMQLDNITTNFNIKDNIPIETVITDSKICSLLHQANLLNSEIQEKSFKLQELEYDLSTLNSWVDNKNIKFALSLDDIQKILDAKDYNIFELEDKAILKYWSLDKLEGVQEQFKKMERTEIKSAKNIILSNIVKDSLLSFSTFMSVTEEITYYVTTIIDGVLRFGPQKPVQEQEVKTVEKEVNKLKFSLTLEDIAKLSRGEMSNKELYCKTLIHGFTVKDFDNTINNITDFNSNDDTVKWLWKSLRSGKSIMNKEMISNVKEHIFLNIMTKKNKIKPHDKDELKLPPVY